VNTRRPLVRALIGLGLMCGAVIALASSIVLHGAALVVVLLAAAIAAFAAYAAREDAHAAAVDAAWKAAAATASAIVLVTGVGVLAGRTVAVLVSGFAVVTAVAVWLLTTSRARPRGARASGAASVPDDAEPAPLLAPAWKSQWHPPVCLLPTSALGSEWLLTRSALTRPVELAARQEIIRRRQETLDELERRDPAGFARWLAAGAATDSDPATFVRGDRTTESDAA
jgi:hypothetical protein